MKSNAILILRTNVEIYLSQPPPKIAVSNLPLPPVWTCRQDPVTRFGKSF